MKPRALDLFCGAGGISVGLARAGFEGKHRRELKRRAEEKLAEGRRTISVTGSVPQTNVITNQARETFSTDDARAAMGCPWMPMRFLSQAIPPAYGKWIGKQALAYLASLES